MKVRNVLTILVIGFVACLALFVNDARAQSYESVRESDSDWYCMTDGRVVLSEHTRQDKAQEACANRALAQPGVVFRVTAGEYRVVAEGGTVQPPIIDPPPVDPGNVLGPVSDVAIYPATHPGLKQDYVRWQLKFTLNTLPLSKSEMGLASRDEYGQAEGGHLSVWINSSGKIQARNQDIEGGGDNLVLYSTTTLAVGVEYTIDVSIHQEEGFGLFVNGELEDYTKTAYGLSANDLPLVLGGLCTRCDLDASPVIGPDRPIDGAVVMVIHEDPLPLPDAMVVHLSWEPPYEYEDCVESPPENDKCGTEILEDELIAFKLYQQTVYEQGDDYYEQIAQVTADTNSYDHTVAETGEYCFVATAIAAHADPDTGEILTAESTYSNSNCKTFQ